MTDHQRRKAEAEFRRLVGRLKDIDDQIAAVRAKSSLKNSGRRSLFRAGDQRYRLLEQSKVVRQDITDVLWSLGGSYVYERVQYTATGRHAYTEKPLELLRRMA